MSRCPHGYELEDLRTGASVCEKCSETHRTEDQKNRQNKQRADFWKIPARARLKPMKDGKRRCYATLMAFELNGQNVELVIGASNRKLVREIFEKLAPGHKVIPELIHDVYWSKVDE